MPSAKPLKMDINKLITPKPTPNYQAEVLDKLHAAQAAKAKADAEAAAQAAAQQAALEAQRVVQVSQAPARVQVTGDCHAWEVAAGITDFADAEYILTRESGCNPNSINASSGACGVGQALPCSKMGCALGDGYCQMVWFRNYVMGRYGSFANAVAFWRAHNWY